MMKLCFKSNLGIMNTATSLVSYICEPSSTTIVYVHTWGAKSVVRCCNVANDFTATLYIGNPRV